MIRTVATWACKCGVSIKAIGETDKSKPATKVVAACPNCRDNQEIYAHRIISVTSENIASPTIMKPNINPQVQLRASMTDAQAEQLQRRLSTLPFKVDYQEEQHGAVLVGVIGCAPVQEKVLRDILRDVGAAMAEGREP